MGFEIGNYKGYKCYQLESRDQVPDTVGVIYVDTKGSMYYGGVRIGRLNPANYTVKEFDMGIYEAKMKARQHRHEVAVPACVAESTAVGSEVSTEVNLCGTDEFFARVALEIDEILNGAGKFNGND